MELFLAPSSEGDSERHQGYSGHPGSAGQPPAPGSVSCGCGSWVLPATSALLREFGRSQPALVQSLCQNAPAHVQQAHCAVRNVSWHADMSLVVSGGEQLQALALCCAFQVSRRSDSTVETSLPGAAAGRMCSRGLFSVVLPQLSLPPPRANTPRIHPLLLQPVLTLFTTAIFCCFPSGVILKDKRCSVVLCGWCT